MYFVNQYIVNKKARLTKTNLFHIINMEEVFILAKIIIYNNDTNRMEVYYRGEEQAMPYNTNNTLKIREFRGSSRSNILWTDKRTMQSWNSFRYLYGRPIYVGFAFRRSYEGGHSAQSQHYAGTAFDIGQTATNAQRTAMRNVAVSSGVWSYVEPASLTPTWVHVDRRFGTPACATGGFPMLRQGSRGNYVLIAQDGLNTLGYTTGGLDGIFGTATNQAVRRYQQRYGLAVDGIIGCNTWRSIQENVLGTGATSTTIN